MTTPRIILKSRKALPFYARHPWVLHSAIDRIDGSVTDGCEVDLVSDKGSWIARGLYNGNSRIRVRLYTWCEGESIDRSLWHRRIASAIGLRRQLGYLDDAAGAVRLVFSEADFVSGLIVDRFAGHVVVQVNALGIAQRITTVVEVLRELIAPASITIRTDEAAVRREGINAAETESMGDAPNDVVFIMEHGLRYGVELAGGQKTGFYLDQRENRRHVARYLRGRRVLDVCCYSGDFSLMAASWGQASHVTAIDSSEHAIALANANAQLNQISNVHFQAGDMFRTLEALGSSGTKVGAVILDPPKFVRGKSGVRQALQAYHRLNRLAAQLLEPDGLLATCSCSGNVSPQQFVDMLFGVATKVRRDFQILEQHGAAPDHPVAVTCPETQYLKCVICRVL